MANPWWVFWIIPLDAKTGQQQFHIIQAASAPVSGTQELGGIVGNVEGPFPTDAAAQKAVGSSTGNTGTGPGLANPNAQANQPPASPLTGIAAIGDFFNKLGQANTWIRVAEVVLGVALIGIGIAHATGADNAISKAAKTAVKAGALA